MLHFSKNLNFLRTILQLVFASNNFATFIKSSIFIIGMSFFSYWENAFSGIVCARTCLCHRTSSKIITPIRVQNQCNVYKLGKKLAYKNFRGFRRQCDSQICVIRSAQSICINHGTTAFQYVFFSHCSWNEMPDKIQLVEDSIQNSSESSMRVIM